MLLIRIIIMIWSILIYYVRIIGSLQWRGLTVQTPNQVEIPWFLGYLWFDCDEMIWNKIWESHWFCGFLLVRSPRFVQSVEPLYRKRSKSTGSKKTTHDEAHRAKWDQSHQLQVEDKYNSSYIQVWNTRSENPMGFSAISRCPGPRLLWTAVQAEAFPVRLLPRLGISFVTPDSGPVTGGVFAYRWDGWQVGVGNEFSERGGICWENYI